MASRSLERFEPVVIVVGLVLHLWGMIDNHRAEANTPRPMWSTAAYWLCWISLVVLAVFVVARAL